MCSHQLFKFGLHFPNKPEALRSILFVFHCDIHGAMLVFWYAGFQARSLTQKQRLQAEQSLDQALEPTVKQVHLLGARTPKVDYGSLPVTMVMVPNSREEVPHEVLPRLRGGSW